MADDRLMIVCRACGESTMLAKLHGMIEYSFRKGEAWEQKCAWMEKHVEWCYVLSDRAADINADLSQYRIGDDIEASEGSEPPFAIMFEGASARYRKERQSEIEDE